MDHLANRRLFFDAQWKAVATAFSPWRLLIRFLPLDVRAHHTCPCCGYPTLRQRIDWEICPVCWWEDDGQDDANARDVKGSPDVAYSLIKARKNFATYTIMFGPVDERFERIGSQTKLYRTRLISAFDNIKEAIVEAGEKNIPIAKVPKIRKLYKEIQWLLKNRIT